MSMDNFMAMCLAGQAEPEHWEKWLKDFPEDMRPSDERLGLVRQEYEDLQAGRRSMGFFVMKRRYARRIFNIWSGCYVKYLFETEQHEPRVEFGWVDAVNPGNGYCRIQCDVSFNGMRTVTIRCMDIVEILPMKERPLVYYKTMVCGDCQKCDRTSGELPPLECPSYAFLSACLDKSESDRAFMRLYEGIDKKEESNAGA